MVKNSFADAEKGPGFNQDPHGGSHLCITPDQSQGIRFILLTSMGTRSPHGTLIYAGNKPIHTNTPTHTTNTSKNIRKTGVWLDNTAELDIVNKRTALFIT